MPSPALRNTLRIVIDVVMLIVAALLPMVFKFGTIKPTQRGFFCNDESIRYPYHDGTISTPVLILVSCFTNLAAFITCEVLHYVAEKRKGTTFRRERFLNNLSINPCVYTICGYIWVLGFGVLVTQSLTDVGKWSVGRLRPHFIDGCKPVGDLNLTECITGQYILDVQCSQQDKNIFKDLRLSFPSGHASMSSYAMVFLTCYLQQRVPRFSYSYLFKHVLQFIAILMAWFCCISRVMDNKHHPTDVLAGFLIGTVVALLCVKFITKGFRNPYQNGPFRRVGMTASGDICLPRIATDEQEALGHRPLHNAPMNESAKSTEDV